MFVHFDSNRHVQCDDCGDPNTLMHVSMKRSDRSMDLCATCFKAFALAISYGSEKLRFFKN